MKNYYLLSSDAKIHFPKMAKSDLFNQILSNHMGSTINYNINYDNNDFVITIGTPTIPQNIKLSEKQDYFLNVDNNGVYICANTYSALIRGFLSFCENIFYSKDENQYAHLNITTTPIPSLRLRSIHFCVFPDTSLEALTKYIRTSAMSKYTHIILEFWGGLKYDFMSELAWDSAYTKDDLKGLIDEIHLLGLEIIPMFNHLGHAPGSRSMHGKHVVLDQNPSLEYLFKSYGWVWDYENPQVVEIMRNVRKELIELCGEGQYFHIGCDEVFAEEKDALGVVKYVNEVAKELEQLGRRTIMWGDMMLYGDGDAYLSPSEIMAETAQKHLDRNIIIADWHYAVEEPDWVSSKLFKDLGFDVLCCPFESYENVKAAVDTAVVQEHLGVISTTWHSLISKFKITVVYCGLLSYDSNSKLRDEANDIICSKAATYLRKMYPSDGTFENAGWHEKEIGPGL